MKDSSAPLLLALAALVGAGALVWPTLGDSQSEPLPPPPDRPAVLPGADPNAWNWPAEVNLPAASAPASGSSDDAAAAQRATAASMSAAFSAEGAAPAGAAGPRLEPLAESFAATLDKLESAKGQRALLAMTRTPRADAEFDRTYGAWTVAELVGAQSWLRTRLANGLQATFDQRFASGRYETWPTAHVVMSELMALGDQAERPFVDVRGHPDAPQLLCVMWIPFDEARELYELRDELLYVERRASPAPK